MLKPLLLAGLSLAITAAAMTAATAAPKRLDLAKPEDAITAFRKVQCSTKDGEAVVYHWVGEVYSRVEGEADKHMFNLQGMNVRQCVTVTDPVRGKGFRQVSRELMLYTDPKTGAIIRTWTNPWTGKTLDVGHVANDPVNMRAPQFPIGADGKPYTLDARVQNGRVFMPTVVPLFYTNTMGGEYQQYVGNQYHAMEIFDFVVDEADLLDAAKPRANASVAWVRMSPWLPWMEMTGRGGVVIFNAIGQTLPGGIAGLPKVITDEIAASYPAYTAPPPGDDTRPNETSWTTFKKQIDARRAAAKAAPK
ncbi:MAG: DUF1838 family protein [Polymorphobacter sp.]